MATDQVTILLDGKEISCRPDTSIAAALWENGIRHLSHSHKFGHHRGLTCARGHCTACLMRVDGEPNVRTCETPVRAGQVVQTQDSGAVYGPPMQKMLDMGGNLFPVGFYYKWFTRPPLLSKAFLTTIRPMTGIGRIPDPSHLRALPAAPAPEDAPVAVPSRDLGRFETLVVGAGPSGLAAALDCDHPVTVVDENKTLGGQRYAALASLTTGEGPGLDRFPGLGAAWRRVSQLVTDFEAADHCTFRPDTRVAAGYSPNGLVLRTGSDLFTAGFSTLAWCAGALDTLGLFPGNDTPGLIGPRALYRLLMRDGLNVAGSRALVIGGGLDFWLTANLLATRGVRVNLVVTEPGWQSEVSAAVDLGWQLTTGLQLETVHPRSESELEAVFVPGRATPGPADAHLNLRADFAVMCGRGKPAYDIPYQLGADLAVQPARGGYAPAGITGDRHTAPLPGGHTIAYAGEAAGNTPDAMADPTRKDIRE